MASYKLWINDVRVNGYRVLSADGKAHKYFSTKGDDKAKQKASAEAKKIGGSWEASSVVMGNVDELDRAHGSLRVPLELFAKFDSEVYDSLADAQEDDAVEIVVPSKHELHSFDAKDIYFDFDKETGERTSSYIKADSFEYGGIETLNNVGRQSVVTKK